MGGLQDSGTTESLKILFLVFGPKFLKFNNGQTLLTAEFDLLYSLCKFTHMFLGLNLAVLRKFRRLGLEF